VVVPSQYLKDVFSRRGLPASVIANAVDDSRFQFRLRKPLRPMFLCTRSFEPYYRVDLVVRAFTEVRREFAGARLLLVGGGSLEAAIRRLVEELGIRDSVEFIGTVQNDVIHQQYERADIFINASVVDNMPVSILEAFASGCVVVSSAPGGIAYLVKDGHTGLLSPTEDFQQLAQNAMRLLRNPEMASRMAEAALGESVSYRWSAIRNQWITLYEALAAGQSIQGTANLIKENPWQESPNVFTQQ
jgi:glycosyltransferase involved in cell wall biosynthesis